VVLVPILFGLSLPIGRALLSFGQVLDNVLHGRHTLASRVLLELWLPRALLTSSPGYDTREAELAFQSPRQHHATSATNADFCNGHQKMTRIGHARGRGLRPCMQALGVVPAGRGCLLMHRATLSQQDRRVKKERGYDT
jgi:hypothetical protein